jgi:hypothetical protein
VRRVPNAITNGTALTVYGTGIAIGIFEVAFIIMTALIIVKGRRVQTSQREELR